MFLSDLFEKSLIIDRPAFKSWFAGSKVVDKSGNPLRVYHSTLSKNPSLDFYPGSHFGTIRAANDRLNDRKHSEKGSPHIYPVYLSIKNPLRVNDMAASDEATLLNYLIRNAIGVNLSIARNQGAYAALLKFGHDGLFYENNVEDVGNDSWVIFKSDQVRSAI